MINQDKLNKMYESFLNATTLTTKELNSYGFNSNELAALIFRN